MSPWSPPSTAAPTRSACWSPARSTAASSRSTAACTSPGSARAWTPPAAFHPDALARTLDAMADFGAELDALGVATGRVVATSAARDAANRGVLRRGPRPARRGRRDHPRRGGGPAVVRRRASARCPTSPQPVLVMDIGGGSTELVLGSDGQARTRDLARHRLGAAAGALPALRSAAAGRGRRRDRLRRRAAGRVRRRFTDGRHLDRRRRHGDQPVGAHPGAAHLRPGPRPRLGTSRAAELVDLAPRLLGDAGRRRYASCRPCCPAART